MSCGRKPRPWAWRDATLDALASSAEVVALTATSALEGGIVGAVRAVLAGAGDPTRALAQQTYLKSEMPCRGITAPELRTLLRPLLRDPDLTPAHRVQWEEGVRTLWDGATHREDRYAAIALSGHRAARSWQGARTLGLYRHLVVTGAWWDLVDPVAADRVGPILLLHRAAATPLVRGWAEADEMWLRRTALLAQLKHRAATDLDLLAGAIDANLEGTAYGSELFIRKAIGWALRQHAATDPTWVRSFVSDRHDRLSGLSRREALKHL